MVRTFNSPQNIIMVRYKCRYFKPSIINLFLNKDGNEKEYVKLISCQLNLILISVAEMDITCRFHN